MDYSTLTEIQALQLIAESVQKLYSIVLVFAMVTAFQVFKSRWGRWKL